MKNIEVTEQTFNKVFTEGDLLYMESKETHVIEHFINEHQRGKRIFNYVSSVWQYYLIDINA